MLTNLIADILERGASAASFQEIASKIAELDPADRVLVLMQALSKNQDLMLVRLHLAKLLWQLDCAPFALEQLQFINANCEVSGSEAIKKLIEKLGGRPNETVSSKHNLVDTTTLASVDFDIEVLDPDK